MKHRSHAYALVAGLAALAGMVFVTGALAAHSGKRANKGRHSGGTYTYKSGLNRFEPGSRYVYKNGKVIPASGLGSVTIKMRTLSRRTLLITGVTIKSAHAECIEYTNAEPPERRFTMRYSKSVRAHEKVYINTDPEKELTEFFRGKLGEQNEWLWEISAMLWVKPNGVMYPDVATSIKLNEYTNCSIGGIAKKTLRFREGAWR
jgi:hypothetical protein